MVPVVFKLVIFCLFSRSCLAITGVFCFLGFVVVVVVFDQSLRYLGLSHL